MVSGPERGVLEIVSGRWGSVVGQDGCAEVHAGGVRMTWVRIFLQNGTKTGMEIRRLRRMPQIKTNRRETISAAENCDATGVAGANRTAGIRCDNPPPPKATEDRGYPRREF